MLAVFLRWSTCNGPAMVDVKSLEVKGESCFMPRPILRFCAVGRRDESIVSPGRRTCVSVMVCLLVGLCEFMLYVVRICRTRIS